jgi:hypothetical protein
MYTFGSSETAETYTSAQIGKQQQHESPINNIKS